ncbi:MAG: hypothetical protein WCE21_00150 [Candidatus Babeliales bacterium]
MLMHTYKRIAIIGSAGAGKSVLAKQLQELTKLPLYHLDQYFWKPNWTHPDLAKYKIVHDELCDKDIWIIEGMNLSVMMYRLFRADCIIFLDIPRYQSFWRIFKRVWRYYGTQTPSSAPNCSERINKKFLQFLWWVWKSKHSYMPRVRRLLEMFEGEKPIYILKSQKEIDQFTL